MDEPPTDDSASDDIDPTLLLETGRASAVQDLAAHIAEVEAQGKTLSDESGAIRNVLIDNIDAENRRFRRRNNVLLTVTFCLLFSVGALLWRSVFVTGPQIDRTEQTVTGPLSDANRKLDELVTYIEAQQARADAGAATVQLALAQIDQLRALICASEDPARLEACGQTPPPTTAPPMPTAPRIPATTPTSVAPYLAPTPSTTCPTLPNGKCRSK